MNIFLYMTCIDYRKSTIVCHNIFYSSFPNQTIANLTLSRGKTLYVYQNYESKV